MTSQTETQERISSAFRQALPALLGILAFALALLGQERFVIDDRGRLHEGILLFALAALCLAVARHLLRYPAAPPALPRPRAAEASVESAPRGLLWRWAATGVGILIICLVLAVLADSVPPPSYEPLFWGWVLASVLVTGAWLLPGEFKIQKEKLKMNGERRESALSSILHFAFSPNGGLKVILNSFRWDLVAVGSVTLLAAVLRFPDLASALPTINGDEGSVGLEVRRVLAGELRNPFGLIWGSHSGLVAFIMASFARVLGPSVGSLRLLGATLGTLAIPATYLLARLLTGRRLAVVAALFLAAAPLHLHYSRLALVNAWDSFTFPTVLAALWWGMRRDQRETWPFALAGLVAGLGQYPYVGSRLIVIIVVLWLVYLVLFDSEPLRGKGLHLLVMALVFAVVVSPHYLNAVQEPDLFNSRINQEGILQNGWLRNEAQARAESPLYVLWDQFRRALFGFAFFPDRSGAWNSGTPLAPPLLGLGLFLGLIASLRRWRDPAVLLLHGWFWAVILTAGMLTLNPPTSNRLISAIPAVCIFAALGWEGMARALARAWRGERQRRVAVVLLALFAGVTLFTGVHAHQRYLANNRFGGTEALIATRVGYTLAEMPQETTLVLMGAPLVYSDISPLVFLTPGYTRRDIIDPLTAPPTDLDTGNPLLFAILPGRESDMNFVLQAFPDGQLTQVHAPDNGELLYYQIAITP
ncbi:MAG TPA: glycosyltransferase family 39 protein [Ardenticatenaceae bacterium]|jgi:4-amino-4-deoxy-L-arabinose transferase-like glycosyltransferase